MSKLSVLLFGRALTGEAVSDGVKGRDNIKHMSRSGVIAGELQAVHFHTTANILFGFKLTKPQT